MEPNQPKALPLTSTKAGSGQKTDGSATAAEKVGYQLSTEPGTRMPQPPQIRPWANDGEHHPPLHRPEYNTGNAPSTLNIAENRDSGITSVSSFGLSIPSQGQVQQHVALRGPMYVPGQSNNSFSQASTNQTNKKVSSFDLSKGSGNSPINSNTGLAKSVVGGAFKNFQQLSQTDKASSASKLINRIDGDVPSQTGAVAQGGAASISTNSTSLGQNRGLSPQSVTRPTLHAFAPNDVKSQIRQTTGISNLSSAPSAVGAPTNSGPVGQLAAIQKTKGEPSFVGTGGFPHQLGGQRVASTSLGTQPSLPLPTSRQTLPITRTEAASNVATPNSVTADKNRRTSRNETSIPVHNRPISITNQVSSFTNQGMVRQQQQLQQQNIPTHITNQHGPSARRPLPIMGSQAPRIPTPGIPAASSQEASTSPKQNRNSTPPATIASRGHLEDNPKPPASRQPPPPPFFRHSQVAALSVSDQYNRGGNAVGGQRELRVEDALLYLDEVKREFKDRPTIYNEFLSIMKNFKSQEVDTPGVIFRVSTLFRGYNNLILGFNTFLPDGYKISQADLERQDAEREAIKITEVPRPGPKPKPTKPQTVVIPIQQAPTPQPPPRIKTPISQPPAPQSVLQPGQARLQAPLPGVRGRPNEDASQTHSTLPVPTQAPPQPVLIPPRPSPSVSRVVPPVTPATGALPTRPSVPITSSSQLSVLPTQQQQASPQHQGVEFDHAISYVTTIKKRFSNDPGTYHSFLGILHTYQKEQRGIREVLEQVAHLFQDHPDLLKEFTFFLPDAVQEQAKERLHRAAAESESRLAAQRQQMMEQYQNRVGVQAPQNTPVGADLARRPVPTMDPVDVRIRKRQLEGIPAPVPQPEPLLYNTAVERQFFDSAREALSAFTKDGGQAWAEFLKCLDMYAQDILSRTDMLNLVEPLLGKRNSNLFEEFKRILNAAGAVSGSTALVEDSWYSVPLAEIDFSRCRRCSPSYRALPRDYPAHPTSGRSPPETKVLNDVWVSLPVGSEESYTFRHMRRNTYEESLFRVEDERFEIDMAIDSNAATLHRLEPVAEEIALLARADVFPQDLGVVNSREGGGIGGKRFQYKFDKTILGVIHRNSIARIYGDSGKEMLELVEKNPTVAVPLVVTRLRQKKKEWVKVRNRLNKQWKELAEQNYYKSLDHRSLTWRTVDKRGISTRTLIAEIKDRAANFGREGKEAKRQKLDKAKEEHGTFYEVTVGSKLDQDLDLTYLPKPDRRLFTPHHSLLYTNSSWTQRDAYRILAFALERGPISPADKERCHRLWVDFLGPWFGLSVAWMQRPASSYQESFSSSRKHSVGAKLSVVSEDEEEERLEIERESSSSGRLISDVPSSDLFTDHHPLPAGAHVATIFGEGKILQYRKLDHMYKISLGIGVTGFLRPSSVLCSIVPVENSASTRQLRTEDKSKLARPRDQLIFGTQSLYLFFRLHHVLIQRLDIAKQLAYSVDSDSSLQNMVERIPNSNASAIGKLRYESYLSLLYSSLDGGVTGTADGGKYEDRVRSLLGHGAYELATMDKLISHIWKDIQTIANDENMLNLIQLYCRHMLAGSFQPEAFRQEAAYISEGEPLYAFQHCPMPESDQSVLHMEYIGVMDDGEDDPMDAVLESEHVSTSNKRARR